MVTGDAPGTADVRERLSVPVFRRPVDPGYVFGALGGEHCRVMGRLRRRRPGAGAGVRVPWYEHAGLVTVHFLRRR